MNIENVRLLKDIANKHPVLFFSLLSENYPFSKKDLQKFEDKLDWVLLSSNPNLEWTDELIETFDYKWDWDKLIQNRNIKISNAMMQKYELFKYFGYSTTFEP